MEETSIKRYSKRRRNTRLIVIVIVIIAAIAAVLAAFLIRRYKPSGSTTDYAEYYGLTTEEAVMINFDDEVLEGTTALYLNDEVYLPYDFFHTDLNARFYWDDTEQILRYVLPEGIVNVPAETEEYTFANEPYVAEYPVVHIIGDTMYISLSFLDDYTNIRWEFYEDPNRVVISDEWGEASSTEVIKNTEVRELGGIKSSVLTKLTKGDSVTILEEMESWSKVCTGDGFVGYVKNNTLGETESLIYTSDFVEPVYPHNLKDFTICMAWHQTTNQASNELVSSVLESTEGINVICPTWFYLSDNSGGIQSLASADYVEYCHQNGIEVWALVSNVENPDVDTTSVLNDTSKRDALISNLMAEAVKCNVDGINVDFESLSGEAGTGFLEFIRELSLRCASNNMVLSVDNYAPALYNLFYGRSEQAVFADYIVIMAYDEHYVGSDEGSVSSIGFVRQSVADTLDEVPADQVILGLPFYTRLWKLTPTADGYDVSSEALGMTEAESRVLEHGSEFNWLADAGQYFGTYEADGSTYDVWLEDETSLGLKLDVVKESGLAGFAFWRLGFEKSSVWETIVKYTY